MSGKVGVVLGLALAVKCSLAIAAEPAGSFNLDSQSAAQEFSDQVNPARSASITDSAATEGLYDSLIFTLNDHIGTMAGFDYYPFGLTRWPSGRGIAGSINLMIDGVSITSPVDYGFSSGWDLFLEEFNSVESVTGPAGVLWGGYSLLGNVNLATKPKISRSSSSYSYMSGSEQFNRATAMYEQSFGEHSLRLFAGFGFGRQLPYDSGSATLTVPPFGSRWRVGDDDVTGRPNVDTYAVVSAQYSTPSLKLYIRVPYVSVYAQQSKLGADLDVDQSRRVSRDSLASLSWQKVIAPRTSFQLRSAWYRFQTDVDEVLLPKSSWLETAPRSSLHIDMSRFSIIGEFSHRLIFPSITNDTIVGAEGQYEMTHDSSFAGLQADVEPWLTTYGPAIEKARMATYSVYGFDELQLFDRLTLNGGGRFYNGNNNYANTWILQAGTTIRLLGASHLKFGITQGMRPPLLLDRVGIVPVVGRQDLVPETSSALQIEFDGEVKNLSLLRSAKAKANYSITNIRNLISREQGAFAAYTSYPVNRSGGISIASVEASLALALQPLDSNVRLMFRRNTHTDSRASSANIAQSESLNPLCIDDDGAATICSNFGPRDRYFGRVRIYPLEHVSIQATVDLRCGGNIASAALTGESARPTRETRERRCYTVFDAASQYRVSEQASVAVSVLNVQGTRHRLGSYSLAELRGGEPANAVTSGRFLFAVLRWSTAQVW